MTGSAALLRETGAFVGKAGVSAGFSGRWLSECLVWMDYGIVRRSDEAREVTGYGGSEKADERDRDRDHGCDSRRAQRSDELDDVLHDCFDPCSFPLGKICPVHGYCLVKIAIAELSSGGGLLILVPKCC